MTRRSAIWIFIFVFFLLLIAAAANSEERTRDSTTLEREGRTYDGVQIQSGDEDADVAIVPIEGVIQNGDSDATGAVSGGDDLVRLIDEISEGDEFEGIILQVNTPGGAVLASDEAARAVKRAQKRGIKVVAWMRDTAASGGYYISAPADRIVAAPATITGSIGVILQYFNVEGLAGKVGVKAVTIKSAENKDIGSSFNDLTPEQRKILQSIIDEAYGDFLGVVSDARDIDEEDLRPIADGRIYTGRQALELGLVDELGTRDKAYDVMADLLKESDGDDLEVTEFERRFGIFDSVGASARQLDFSQAARLAAGLLLEDLAGGSGGVAPAQMVAPGMAAATQPAMGGLPRVEYRAVL